MHHYEWIRSTLNQHFSGKMLPHRPTHIHIILTNPWFLPGNSATKKRGFRWRVEHRSTSQRISSNFFRRRWSISEIFEIWNWCTVGNVGTCWNSCTYGNFFRLQGTESVLQQIWRSMSRVVVSSPPTDSLSRSTTFSRSVTTPSLVSRRWLRVGGFLWTGCCYVLLVVDRSNIPPILAFFQHNQPLEFFWAPALAPGKNLHSTEVKWYGWWFNMI